MAHSTTLREVASWFDGRTSPFDLVANKNVVHVAGSDNTLVVTKAQTFHFEITVLTSMVDANPGGVNAVLTDGTLIFAAIYFFSPGATGAGNTSTGRLRATLPAGTYGIFVKLMGQATGQNAICQAMSYTISAIVPTSDIPL